VSGAGRATPRADVRADVVVLGGGIVGLAIATTLADAALSVALIAVDRPGAAARAAAGLLVPHYSGEAAGGAVERFMAAARDAYPAYVRGVEERSGMAVPFDASGALEVAATSEEYSALVRHAPSDARLLTPEDVGLFEPALAPTSGGVLYPKDGAVDNVRLTDALASIASRDPRIRTVRDAAIDVELHRDSVTVVGESGTRIAASRVVIAAGAWSGNLEGLPRRIPVRPVRGQICTLRGTPLRRVVLGPEVYLVSRGGDRTLVGSTMEDVGFDARTTPEAIDSLHRAAARACPALERAALLEAWSGLRPVTPDLLPILGSDPEYPAIVYACGHSRNGILLAPLTAAVTTRLILADGPEWDLSPFAVTRFGAAVEVANLRGSN
jgi:glycine oxidase